MTIPPVSCEQALRPVVHEFDRSLFTARVTQATSTHEYSWSVNGAYESLNDTINLTDALPLYLSVDLNPASSPYVELTGLQGKEGTPTSKSNDTSCVEISNLNDTITSS